jgi:hypothetical protein
MRYEVRLSDAEKAELGRLIGHTLDWLGSDGFAVEIRADDLRFIIVPDEEHTPDAVHPYAEATRPMLSRASKNGPDGSMTEVGSSLGTIRSVRSLSTFVSFTPVTERPALALPGGVVLGPSPGYEEVCHASFEAAAAALALATLVGLIGLFAGWQYLVEFNALSGAPRWARVVAATLPPIAGAVTIAVVMLTARRKRVEGLWPSLTLRRWALCAFMIVVGYLVARDGLSSSLYLGRPGGLPGGCYTDLEVWLRVPHQDSWVRSLEQALGSASFFLAPLILLVARRRTSPSLSALGAERHGA